VEQKISSLASARQSPSSPPPRNMDLISTLLLRHVSCQLQNYRTLSLSHLDMYVYMYVVY